VGGREACDEDCGLSAGELVPASCGRERLGEHRSSDDDVVGGGVWSDGPVAASAGEDLFEDVSDLGLKRDDLVVMDDRAAVEREDELVAGRDRVVKELRECCGGRLVAQRGGARVLQDETERAPGESGEEGGARREVAVDGSDSDSCLVGDRRHRHFLAVAPDGDRGGGEDAFAVGCGVASRSPRGASCVCRCFGHPRDHRASSETDARVR
jgi:hypothetical protein